MLLSYNSLKCYVDVSHSPGELADLLTSFGLEVASRREVGRAPKNVVVGVVKSVGKHPNADRLALARVGTSEGEFQIVCGSKNLKANAKVAVALHGAALPNGQLIRKQKVRGFSSEGMICSRAELGLEAASDDVRFLPSGSKVNEPLQLHMGEADVLMELELPSNRPDCQSTIGIAKQVAAITNVPLHSRDQALSFSNQFHFHIRIEDKSLCSRYALKIVKEVGFKQSPMWLQSALHNLNINNINAAADITNYLQHEYGQPMHAFDLELIKGNTIHVRNAKPKERLQLLNDDTLDLHEADLVIADEEGPLALAGVMGGARSAVGPKTRHVLFEAACFEPRAIAEAVARHGLQTPSSSRFERGVAPMYVADVLNEAAYFMLHGLRPNHAPLPANLLAPKSSSTKLSSKTRVSVTYDSGPHVPSPTSIMLRLNQVAKHLGITLPLDKLRSYCQRLNLKITYSDRDKLQIEVPMDRADLRHEWDLLEEVAKLYGYNNLPETLPILSNASLPASSSPKQTYRQLAEAMGYHQAINFSFLERQYVRKFFADEASLVELSNPISSEFAFLRSDLAFGLLNNLAANHNRNNPQFNKVYELGNVFQVDANEGYVEDLMVGFLGSQHTEVPNWTTPSEPYDLHNMTSTIQSFLRRLGYVECLFSASPHPIFATTQSASIAIRDTIVGKAGLLHPNLLNYFGMKGLANVYYADLNLSKLRKIKPVQRLYKPTSIYPSTSRDLAIVVDKSLPISPIMARLLSSHSLVREVTLTNVYEGPKIPKSKKSVLFNIEMNSHDRTLGGREADRTLEKIINALRKHVVFELR